MEDSETKTHPEQQVDTDLTNPPVTNAENGVRKDEPRKEDLVTNEDHVQESSENVKVPTETGPVGDGSIAIAANPTTPAQETMQEANCDGVIDSDVPYMAPLDDPLDKAAKFLSKHDIFGLLQNITAGIAYKRPADALQFMIGEIEKLQEEDRRRQGVITRTSSAKSTEQQQAKDGNPTSTD